MDGDTHLEHSFILLNHKWVWLRCLEKDSDK